MSMRLQMHGLVLFLCSFPIPRFFLSLQTPPPAIWNPLIPQSRTFVLKSKSEIEDPKLKIQIRTLTPRLLPTSLTRIPCPFPPRSSKSTSPSSSATRLTAWSSWPRRSPSSAIRASISTPRCCRRTATASSTTSETECAATSSPQVHPPPRVTHSDASYRGTCCDQHI